MATRNEAFPSKWLRSEDLAGREYTLTIAACTLDGKYPDGKDAWGLHFKETPKVLGLNKTNWTSVESITGEPDSENWAGHRVTLFVIDTMLGNEPKKGIRIKAAGGISTPPQGLPAPTGMPEPDAADIADAPPPDDIPF